MTRLHHHHAAARPDADPTSAALAAVAAAAVTALVALGLAAAARAAPALEYGCDAEARFIERCDAPGCGCVSERLQEILSYDLYVEWAAGGPEAFAAEPLLRDALARAEAACGMRAGASLGPASGALR